MTGPGIAGVEEFGLRTEPAGWFLATSALPNVPYATTGEVVAQETSGLKLVAHPSHSDHIAGVGRVGFDLGPEPPYVDVY